MQHAREDIDTDERAKQVRSIQLLKAFNLFVQHRFDESLALYSRLGTGANAMAAADTVLRWQIQYSSLVRAQIPCL